MLVFKDADDEDLKERHWDVCKDLIQFETEILLVVQKEVTPVRVEALQHYTS